MKIININPDPNGAHCIKEINSINVPPSWAKLPDNVIVPDTFPFVIPIIDDQVVVEILPGYVPKHITGYEPTTDERVEMLESENAMLKAQVSAQADQAEFYEDCIAEMATVVYA